MKSLHDQIAFRCVHFNGIQSKVCKAGIAYADLKRVEGRMSLPCIKEYGSECSCSKLEFPTKEKVQEELDSHTKAVQRMTIALSTIEPIRKAQKGKDWQGTIECPICKGKLHVSHAAYNGHVHAQCETKDCVAWME